MSIIFKSVFCIVKRCAYLIQEGLYLMKFFSYRFKSCIGSIVGKCMSPATLKLNVIVNLIYHLLKLTRVDPVRAHKNLL